MNRWIRDYFSFSRRDRIAILLLVALIFLTLLLPYFFHNAIRTAPDQTDTAWIALVKALVVKRDSEHLVHSGRNWPEKRAFSRQPYDSAASWKARKFPDRPQWSYPIKHSFRPRLAPIDINIADTSAFIALPGIGSRLAERIVRFREKLGGFYSIDQVGEVYGLADSIFQKIKPLFLLPSFMLKKININTASVDELKSHPYIRYAIANSIVQYRNQHGTYAKLEDLQKIILVSEEIFKKISPYLSLE